MCKLIPPGSQLDTFYTLLHFTRSSNRHSYKVLLGHVSFSKIHRQRPGEVRGS